MLLAFRSGRAPARGRFKQRLLESGQRLGPFNQENSLDRGVHCGYRIKPSMLSEDPDTSAIGEFYHCS